MISKQMQLDKLASLEGRSSITCADLEGIDLEVLHEWLQDEYLMFGVHIQNVIRMEINNPLEFVDGIKELMFPALSLDLQKGTIILESLYGWDAQDKVECTEIFLTNI